MTGGASGLGFAISQRLQALRGAAPAFALTQRPAWQFDSALGERKLLAQLGYVVWLQAPVDVILQRTGRNRVTNGEKLPAAA